MKDLDFDELDRAVNSLMTNVPKSAPQVADTNEKTLDLTSSLGDAQATPAAVEDMAKKATDEVSPVTPPQQPVSVAVSTISPRPAAPTLTPPPRVVTSTPAARRGGRFMDVVHPSSDMKKPEAPKPVSRQGVTIEPMGKASPGEPIVQPVFASSPVMSEAEKEPKEEDVKPVADALSKPTEPSITAEEPKKSTDDHPSALSDWPDPLDMAAKNDLSAPLTSPFLADAKVEKRPLGNPTALDIPSEKTDSDMELPEVEPTVDVTPEAPKEVSTADDTSKNPDVDESPIKPVAMPGEEDIVAPLPEELRNDLMAVEADTTHDEIKQKHDSTGEQISTSEKPTVSEAPKPTEPKTDTTSVPTGPTSIPQQYREEPSTGDQDNGAIYDTNTYHQPLAHPAKKKPGWLWIVWVVVILLLGAAGGAAVYFLKLI